MCDPLSIGLGLLQGIGKMQSIGAQNQASMDNAENALIAMNDENTQTGASFVEQNRALIQGGFDAVLKGRSEESAAFTSAIENGVQGASVRATLRGLRRKSFRNQDRVQQEMDSLRTQTNANFSHIRSKAQGRINQVPTTSFNMGDAATIISPILKTI